MRMIDSEIEGIAKVCHEANKAWCESLGDMTQLHWAEAPQWQKDAAVSGVKHHLENPESLPADSHNAWMRQKLDDGWKWGPVKDAEKKTHPSMVLFEKLSPGDQNKDKLFLNIVRALGR